MSKDKKETPNIRKFRMFAEPVHASINKIATPILKKQGIEAALLKHWRDIVGNELADACQPVKLTVPKGKKSGVLTVEIHPSHALIAQHMQSVILEKLAVYYGYRAVERIQFRQCSSQPLPTENHAVPPERQEMAQKFDALYHSLIG